MTILLVFGLAAVLLLFIALIAQHAGRDIQMASAEETAFQVQQVVASSLNDLAAKAEADPNFWDTEDHNGVGACEPKALYPGAPYPFVCRQVLNGRQVSMSNKNPDWGYSVVNQYPVRVVWQTSSNAEPQQTFAWLVLSPADEVLGVWANRSWCVADSSYYLGGSTLGFCKIGG